MALLTAFQHQVKWAVDRNIRVLREDLLDEKKIMILMELGRMLILMYKRIFAFFIPILIFTQLIMPPEEAAYQAWSAPDIQAHGGNLKMVMRR